MVSFLENFPIMLLFAPGLFEEEFIRCFLQSWKLMIVYLQIPSSLSVSAKLSTHYFSFFHNKSSFGDPSSWPWKSFLCLDTALQRRLLALRDQSSVTVVQHGSEPLNTQHQLCFKKTQIKLRFERVWWNKRLIESEGLKTEFWREHESLDEIPQDRGWRTWYSAESDPSQTGSW